MKVLGLTGGSGTGKGLAAAIFRKYAIPAIDTDALYHEMLTNRNPCTEELIVTFGDHIRTPEGGVDRKALRHTVFGKKNTPALLHTLNTVTHKYIMAETRKLLQHYKKSDMRAAVIDAPLLFEAGADNLCDRVIGILANRALRVARIMSRDGITEEEAIRRIDAQHDDAFFIEKCDAILYNNGTPDELEAQIGDLIMDYVVLS